LLLYYAQTAINSDSASHFRRKRRLLVCGNSEQKYITAFPSDKRRRCRDEPCALLLLILQSYVVNLKQVSDCHQGIDHLFDTLFKSVLLVKQAAMAFNHCTHERSR